MQVLGNKVPSSSAKVSGHLGRPSSVIGEVTSSQSGNVIIRVGQMTELRTPGAWTQTEYVVLTKKEAGDLVVALLEQVIGAEAVEAIRAQEVRDQAAEQGSI